jgi:hypothetical protein
MLTLSVVAGSLWLPAPLRRGQHGARVGRHPRLAEAGQVQRGALVR